MSSCSTHTLATMAVSPAFSFNSSGGGVTFVHVFRASEATPEAAPNVPVTSHALLALAFATPVNAETRKPAFKGWWFSVYRNSARSLMCRRGYLLVPARVVAHADGVEQQGVFGGGLAIDIEEEGGGGHHHHGAERGFQGRGPPGSRPGSCAAPVRGRGRHVARGRGSRSAGFQPASSQDGRPPRRGQPTPPADVRFLQRPSSMWRAATSLPPRLS